MILTQIFLGTVIMTFLALLGSFSMSLMFVDYFGGINVIFPVTPLKFEHGLMNSSLNYVGEFLKIIQFIVGNYLVASYSHKLQERISELKAQLAKDIRLGLWRKYISNLIQAPMMYLLIIAIDVYLILGKVI